MGDDKDKDSVQDTGGGGGPRDKEKDDLFSSIRAMLSEARAASLRGTGPGGEGDNAPPPLHDSSIVRDYSDEMLWKSVTGADDSLTRRAQGEAEERYQSAGDLFRDVFASLYKAVPELRKPGEMRPTHLLNHRMVEEMLGTDEWRALRGITALDALGAAYATRNITRRLIESLSKQTEKAQEAVEKAQDAEDAAAADLGDVAAEGQAAVDEGNIDKAQALAAQAGEIAAELASKEQATNDAAAALHAQLSAAGDRARMALREAARDAAAELGDARAAALALGGDPSSGDPGGAGWSPSGVGGSGPSGGSLREKVKMARAIQKSPRLLSLARRAGKYRILAAAAQRKKTPHSNEEISGTTAGRDLSLLLPGERVRLATPALAQGFYADYAAGKLALAKFRGKARQGEGPVIICLDDSGSMSGLPEQCAKAAMLAIVSVCRAKKRDVAVCVFNTQLARNEVFTKGGSQADWPRLLSLVEYFGGGGTLYDPWITAASAHIAGHQFAKADVIVITDGLCVVFPETIAAWKQLKTDRDFRCVGILIDPSGGRGGAGALGDLCDRVHVLPPATDWPEDALLDIFEQA